MPQNKGEGKYGHCDYRCVLQQLPFCRSGDSPSSTVCLSVDALELQVCAVTTDCVCVLGIQTPTSGFQVKCFIGCVNPPAWEAGWLVGFSVPPPCSMLSQKPKEMSFSQDCIAFKGHRQDLNSVQLQSKSGRQEKTEAHTEQT